MMNIHQRIEELVVEAAENLKRPTYLIMSKNFVLMLTQQMKEQMGIRYETKEEQCSIINSYHSYHSYCGKLDVIMLDDDNFDSFIALGYKPETINGETHAAPK